MKPMNRRHFLRGAGGVGVALPFLEAMLPRRRSWAADAPKRFLVFYTPGGTVLDDWRPKGTESNFTFNSILAPLDPIKRHLLVIEGLDLKVTSEGHGHPHSRGMGGVLTGQPLLDGAYETCGGKAGLAAGPSIDQVIADHINKSLPRPLKLKSLEVAVNWPTDRRDGGKVAPTNCINYSGRNAGVPMAVDPLQVWNKLFKDFGTNSADLAASRARETSVLDAVQEEYKHVASKVSRADQLKLQEHLTRIEELERSLTAADGNNAQACIKPEAPKPLSGGSQSGSGNEQKNPMLDSAMPALGKTMMDLLVMAVSCDLTRVGTMQWSDSQSYNTFPWLNLNENHHAYQHDHGYQPEAIKKINNWYTKQFLYLVQELEKREEGGASLLDTSCVFWVSEIQHPNSHAQDNMPFMLAGSAGGHFRTGRHVKFNRLSHNNLLVNLANAYGIETNTFGKANFCQGALANLS